MDSHKLKKILTEEIDRKQFLVYCGMILLALTGISGFLKVISQTTLSHNPKSKENSVESPRSGFGTGAYGG